MDLKDLNLEKLLISMLEPGVFKTTEQIVQEFRMEYPHDWHELEKEGKRLFGGSCGAYQQPATRITQALFKIPPEKCLCRRDDDGYSWSAPEGGEAPRFA